MMKLKTLTLTAAAAVLAACATATPYQPAAKPGASGFSQTKIQTDRYTVAFSGNSLTNRETVETYLLYRAAEVALENGYSHFALDEKDTEKNTRTVSTGFGYRDPFYRRHAFHYDFYHPRRGWGYGYNAFGPSRFGRRGFDPFWDDFNTREVTKYKAYGNVRLLRGDNGNAYNAREVVENLSPKLVYPAANAG